MICGPVNRLTRCSVIRLKPQPGRISARADLEQASGERETHRADRPAKEFVIGAATAAGARLPVFRMWRRHGSQNHSPGRPGNTLQYPEHQDRLIALCGVLKIFGTLGKKVRGPILRLFRKNHWNGKNERNWNKVR